MVSIIITNYNYGRYLKQCIESVLNQTYNNIELIIIDDCSTDDSWKKLLMCSDDIVFHMNKTNRGVAYCRNKGLELSKGDYIKFLDADDYLMPECIEKEISYIGKSDKIGMVHTGVECNHKHWGKSFNKGILKALKRFGSYFEMLKHYSPICFSSCLFKREALRPFQQIDGEDWLQWLQIAKDYEMSFIPERLTYYRVHPESFTSKVYLNNFDFEKMKSKIHDRFI